MQLNRLFDFGHFRLSQRNYSGNVPLFETRVIILGIYAQTNSFCLNFDIVPKTKEITWIGIPGSKRAALEAPRLL